MKGSGCLCLALLFTCAPVGAETLYKWVDQRGVTHYDEKAPRGIGGTRVDISPTTPSDADYREAQARRAKMVKAARELERRERAERERQAREAAKRDKEERLARERREREAARLAACERAGGKNCGAPPKTHRKRTFKTASD